MGRPASNLLELVFGKLSVIARDANPERAGKAARWMCRCECGVVKSIGADALKSGTTVSCGCFGRRRIIEVSRIHGMTGRPEWRSWSAMLARCTSETNKDYARYGGVGISVCERWKDFPSFLEDMGPRPQGTSLDRIDNSLGYSPSNCRWASWKVQSTNRTNTRFLTVNGETHSAAEWARIVGLSTRTVHTRIARGWQVEDVLRKPTKKRRVAHT